MDREVTPQKTRKGTTGAHRGKSKGVGRANASASRQSPIQVTPTILRAAPPAVATLFNPDQPRQHLLPQPHQKLYEPNSSPTSPPGPFSQPPVRGLANAKPKAADVATLDASAPCLRGWKLINAQLQFCAEVPPAQGGSNWGELTQFQVVGCVGLEGVGKSTLLSLLASSSTSDPWFPTQTLETKLNGKHQTSGIDMCITEDHVVFLDCQPFLSSSMMHELVLKNESPKFGALPLDQQLEVTSLQLLVFLFSVCHHVLVVSDAATDPDLWQLLQNAELLQHRVPSISGEVAEHAAQAIFVRTKAAAAGGAFVPAKVATPFAPSAPPPQFTLPLLEAPSFAVAFEALATHMRRLPKTSLTQKKGHAPLSFKEWTLNAARIYDGLRKLSSLQDYARLLQKTSK
ncbi:protein SMG9 [Achlya hypogyna]|uniref:Protein SMG9 n=1 Tax=Achlya hypogyna TaxID=1202772 RepID=A0A1V9Z4Q1_ACHHY|nr:protein SMG9 [Achlya hypogyna]